MDNSIMQLKNISVGYKNKSIVSSINFEIIEKEFIVLLGKNGVGKSTLINTIMGFQQSLTGDIFLEGKNIKKLSPNEIAKKIAIVLPKLYTVPAIPVIDLLLLARLPYHSKLQSLSIEENLLLDNILDLVGINALKNNYVSELSEGQLQLVMIARALFQDTPLIVLDEPTANLDLENQYKIFNLLEHIKNTTNKSILMITHQIDMALKFANRLWWIENGSFNDGITEEIAYKHNILQKLSGNLVQFNNTNQSFSINKNGLKKISIVGEGEYTFWLKSFLERKGFLIKEKARNTIKIEGENIFLNNEIFPSLELFFKYIEDEEHNYNWSE